MQKLLGNVGKGSIFILSAPAGTGKTTLAHKLTEEFDCVVQSVACTTREPREGEIDGVHYNFITQEEFEQKIQNDEFFEYAIIYGYYYGTSRTWVEKQLEQGKHVLLVIDTQGAMQIKEKLDVTTIFVRAPTMNELKARLLKRSTENEESIEKRLIWAEREMEKAKLYDYMIVNDNLEVAYQVLKCIFIAEEHRQKVKT